MVPLALYLASFALAFAGRPPPESRALRLLLPLALVPLAPGVTEPLGLLLPLHRGGRLGGRGRATPSWRATDRIPAGLTEFYLWVAPGGALGGATTALLAPLAFTRADPAWRPAAGRADRPVWTDPWSRRAGVLVWR